MPRKKTETTEVTIIQPEMKAVIVKSGYNENEAQKIAKGYMPLLVEVAELSKDLAEMNQENPTDEDIKLARKNRLLLVKVRGKVSDKKKEDKEEALSRNKLIDGFFNVVTGTSEITEQAYSRIEKFEEIRIKAEQDKLYEDRSLILDEYGQDYSYIPLGELTGEQFARLKDQHSGAFERKKEQDEKDRLQKIEDDKAEELRLENLEKENERLRLEKIEKDKADQVIMDRIKKLTDIGLKFDGVSLFFNGELVGTKAGVGEATNAKFDSSFKLYTKKSEDLKKEEDKKRKEQEKKDLELKKFQDEQLELKRIEDEKKEKERLAKMAPDKDKVNQLYLSVKNLPIPDFDSPEGKNIAKEVKESLDLILNGIKTLSKNLK